MFNELDLSIVNNFLENSRLKLGGQISGSAILKDPFKNPIFLSDLKLVNLNLNGENFGNGEVLASWINKDKKIHIKTFSGIGEMPAFLIEGDYYPGNSGINLSINLDQFKLNPLLPFADQLISDLTGMVTGNLELRGTLKEPDLNGHLNLIKTSLLVDYLKTRYNFTNQITISKNSIILKNFEITDSRGNRAIGEGLISNNYFKNFRLDLKLETKNFEFLNTTEKDNQLFYRSGEVDTWIMSQDSIRLRGEHNLRNVLAACAIAGAIGISAEAMRMAVEAFVAIPHRLEYVRSWGGADWYNDSIATAPERAMAAIQSFDRPLLLLAGGRDKDLPWDDFARLVVQRVDHVIAFGEAATKIIDALERNSTISQPHSKRPSITSCGNLRQAVDQAAQIVKPGEVVLLSPGGTSYDEFRDFEERGECFKQQVMKL